MYSPPVGRRAFTLVEILIVVVILGILAAIVIPQFTQAAERSKTTVTASVVRTVQTKVFENFAVRGEYPATIEDAWFVEGATPSNPLANGQRDPLVLYDTAASEAMTHPASKTVSAAGSFWYNPTNGTIRALVPSQRSVEETLALYNRANSTALVELDATRD